MEPESLDREGLLLPLRRGLRCAARPGSKDAPRLPRLVIKHKKTPHPLKSHQRLEQVGRSDLASQLWGAIPGQSRCAPEANQEAQRRIRLAKIFQVRARFAELVHLD